MIINIPQLSPYLLLISLFLAHGSSQTTTTQNSTTLADESNSSSSSSTHKISSLNFTSGLIIIGISLIVTLVFMIAIRLSASYFEHRLISSTLPSCTILDDDRLHDESDGEELHGAPILHTQPHLVSHLQGKVRSHEGAEFIKLKHYEGARSPPGGRHLRVQSV